MASHFKHTHFGTNKALSDPLFVPEMSHKGKSSGASYSVFESYASILKALKFGFECHFFPNKVNKQP